MNQLNEDMRRTLNAMRNLSRQVIKEDVSQDDGNSVPYTTNDDLMNSITQACKANFGADFSGNKSPMMYYPEDKDVTITGSIPTLDNATFKFSFNGKHGEGCELTANPIILDDNKLRIINVIYGTYKNWVDELKKSEDIKPMTLRGSDEPSDGQDQTANNNMTPGDDLD